MSARIGNLDFSLIAVIQGHEIILSIDILDVDLCLGINTVETRVELTRYLEQRTIENKLH